MQKYATIILIVTFITGLLAGTYYAAFNTNQAEHAAQLKTLIDTKWTHYCTDKPGFKGDLLISIITPKGTFFAATNNSITQNTHFRGASTTKTFTAAAILLLHQEGKLQIDDKITDAIPNKNITYVPETADYAIPNKNQITIRQLLAHTAGVFDVSNTEIPENSSAPYAGKRYLDYVKEQQPEHTFTFDELVGVVAANQLSYFQPGTSFHYSNTGYSILGKIIEQVSGTSYASFLEQRLLKPNGLDETSFPAEGSDDQLPTPYVEGYTYFNGTLYETTVDNVSPHMAEGNVITTADNLCNWARLLYNGKAGVNPYLAVTMMNVQPTGEEHVVYGLGTEYTEGLGYGHNGAHIGYLTAMRYDPKTDVTIVILASVLHANDVYDELSAMYEIGRSAKQLLGYGTD